MSCFFLRYLRRRSRNKNGGTHGVASRSGAQRELWKRHQRPREALRQPALGHERFLKPRICSLSSRMFPTGNRKKKKPNRILRFRSLNRARDPLTFPSRLTPRPIEIKGNACKSDFFFMVQQSLAKWNMLTRLSLQDSYFSTSFRFRFSFIHSFLTVPFTPFFQQKPYNCTCTCVFKF